MTWVLFAGLSGMLATLAHVAARYTLGATSQTLLTVSTASAVVAGALAAAAPVTYERTRRRRRAQLAEQHVRARADA